MKKTEVTAEDLGKMERKVRAIQYIQRSRDYKEAARLHFDAGIALAAELGDLNSVTTDVIKSAQMKTCVERLDEVLAALKD